MGYSSEEVRFDSWKGQTFLFAVFTLALGRTELCIQFVGAVSIRLKLPELEAHLHLANRKKNRTISMA
jgi:hypothetical protein